MRTSVLSAQEESYAPHKTRHSDVSVSSAPPGHFVSPPDKVEDQRPVSRVPDGDSLHTTETPAARDLVHKLRSRTSRLSVCGCALAGCGKSPPAAFSRHSAAHPTTRVRFATSLAAALLDSHFAHPVACTDAGRHVEPSVCDDAKSEFFRNLLVARASARLKNRCVRSGSRNGIVPRIGRAGCPCRGV